MAQNLIWLDWAVRLQALAQAGLYYGKDPFDRERYAEIRSIAAQMIAHQGEMPFEKVQGLFCCETGYQTPKLDTRAAIFRDDRILLVQEKNGTWSLPGGWVDVDLSVLENVVKEVREEAGLDVTADLVIAVQDREKHNQPVYAYKICKIFVRCTSSGAHSGKIPKPLPATTFRWMLCRLWQRRRTTGNRLQCALRRSMQSIGKLCWISGG